MQERLEIRNFGPIKEVVIDDIKPFTVFVGESGSGKSTIMKVLAIFRWMYKRMNIRSYLKYSGIKKSPFRFTFESYLKNDGIYDYLSDSTFFRYSRGSFVMSYQDSKFHSSQKDVPTDELSLEKVAYLSEKRTLIPDVLEHNLTVTQKAFYLNEAWDNYLLATENIKELEMPFTNVKFIQKKTSQGVKHMIQPTDADSSFSIKLKDASSGIQSSTPLALIVEYYSKYYNLTKAINKSVLSYLSDEDSMKSFQPRQNIGDFKSKRINLFVEEPEISLFPDSQVGLMDFLIDRCFPVKGKDYDITLMLSTHSPYIVNHLNVLLRRPATGIHLSDDAVAVYRVYDGHIQDLVMRQNDSSRIYIDTRDLSETMQTIYEQYTELKNRN